MNKKEQLRAKRHTRIRLKMRGTPEIPRLVFRRSLNNLFAQIIDDTTHCTLFCLSTTAKEIKDKFPHSGNVKAAHYFGEVFSQKAKEKGITKIIFDRSGYLYHGRVKVFADALRKGGLEF